MSAPEKNSKSKRLFFSTIFPEELQDFCVHPPKASSGQEEEQKIFWSLCNYMVRSCHGIHEQIFYASFVKNIEKYIKPNHTINALKQLICEKRKTPGYQNQGLSF